MKPSSAAPFLSLNPELQRNIWLELTPTRVIGMALVLALLLTGIYEVWDVTYLPRALRVFILALVVVWGSVMASARVSEELNERTWDVQRLSAQGAVSLVVGKLAGGTSYAWYGSLLCVGVLAALFPHRLGIVPDLLLTGVAAQATALFIILTLSLIETGSRRINSVAAVAAGIGIGFFFNGIFAIDVVDEPGSVAARAYVARYHDIAMTPVGWYESSVPLIYMARAGAGLLVFWALLGSVRIVRRELGYRDGPLGWTVFTLFVMITLGGLHAPAEWPLPEWTAVPWQARAFAAGLLLTYVPLLCAPVSRAALRSLVANVRAGSIVRSWRGLPPWIPSAALMFLACLAYLGSSSGRALPAFAIIGFALRDLFVIQGMRLRYPVRSRLGLMLFFPLMYMVAPLVIGGRLAYSGESPGIALGLFLPWVSADQPWAAVIPWVEAAIALMIFLGDFRQVLRPVEPSATTT